MPFADTVRFHSALVDAYEEAGYELIAVDRQAPAHRAASIRSWIGDSAG